MTGLLTFSIYRLSVGSVADENQNKLGDFFNIIIHHNSFGNRNSSHCFPMCDLVFQ